MMTLMPLIFGASTRTSTSMNAKFGVRIGDGHLFNLNYLLLLITALLVLPLPRGTNGEDLKLTILHAGDVHARFNQTNKFGGVCTEELAKKEECFGGVARMYHKVKEIRAQEKNVLFLYAGDYFQGTVFYTVFKWKVVSDLANMLNYTALVLGNHEFDDKVEGLRHFIKGGNFPVVATNIDGRNEPKFHALEEAEKVFKSTVVTLDGGIKIGILGYTLGKDISNHENLKFLDPVDALQKEATRLRNKKGLKILIALGHADFNTDKLVAERVPYIDVVVGSHANSFMYNGKAPSSPEKVLTPYPFMMKRKGGPDVPIAHIFPFGKYLGKLDLVFSDKGELKEVTPGNPILLDKSVPQDEDLLKRISLKWGVNDEFSRTVGTTTIVLNGKKFSCQQKECNLGNLITDAIVYGSQRFNVHMALINAGGIRDSINEGPILFSELIQVLPFEDTIDLVEIQGLRLRQVFEHSVRRYKTVNIETTPEFLQMSGIRVLYDVNKPPGARVKSVRVFCHNCKVRGYVPIDDSRTYNLAVASYIARGELGFDFGSNSVSKPESLILDLLVEYLKLDRNNPVKIGYNEGRICFVTDKNCNHNEGSRVKLSGLLQAFILCLFLDIFQRI